MSVRRRKDGRWRVDVVVMKDGKRQRFRKAAATRSEGLALERDFRAKLAQGIAPTLKSPLYSEWAKDFLSVYAATNNKPSEVASKQAILDGHILPFFGDMQLNRIGVESIERFKARQVEVGAKPKSINNRLSVLRRSLVVAVKWKKLDSLPETQWTKAGPTPFRFLDFHDADQLLEHAGAWRTMVLIAMRTGLRRGELLALRWEDINLTAASLQVRRSVWRNVEGTPKNNRTRTIPLSNEAVAALREHPTRFVGGYVFGDGRTRLTPGKLRRPLYNACQRARLGRCGWHVLRHTFASHLAMRGIPLKVIQELLGHATIDMTVRYAHLSPDVKIDAVRQLDSQITKDPVGARSEAGTA
jgi:integrase